MTADNRQLNVILWEIHCTKSNYQRVLTILLPIPYTLELSRYAVFWARMCNPTSKSCVLVTVAIQSVIYNYCFALNECNSNKDADRSCNLGYSLLLKLQHLSFPFLFCWYAYCRFFNCIFFLTGTAWYTCVYPTVVLSYQTASEMKAQTMVTAINSRQKRTGSLLYCSLDPFQQSEGKVLMLHDVNWIYISLWERGQLQWE